MKLMIKKDCINELTLHHIDDVDSKNRDILSEKKQEDKGWNVISNIIRLTWKENKELKREIDYVDAYDEEGNLYENDLKNTFSYTTLVFDYDGSVYAYLNRCESVRIYDFWDLLKMFPRELANLFGWDYIELLDLDSNADEDFKNSMEYSNSEERAFTILSLAAVMECKEVYPFLGDCYKDGDGTDVNLMAAYKCYREALRCGDILGKIRLGEMYMNGLYVEKSYNEALYLFTEASLEGSLDAVEYLAEIYMAKDFNRRDEEMSLIYAEAGAKHGSNICKKILGDYYLNNVRNVDDDENYHKAYKYYDSMTYSKEKYYSLGHYFEVAHGELNINQSTRCFKKAINLGEKQAAYELARIYSSDTRYKDLEQAKEFYNTYLEMGGQK